MNTRISIVVAAAVALLSLAAAAQATDPFDRPERKVVGTSESWAVVPDLADSIEVPGGRVWAGELARDGATFLKPHFVGVNLRAGDTIVVRSRTGHVVERIQGRGPKNMGSFWGLSAMGDQLYLEFHFDHDYATPPFEIDQVIIGIEDLFTSVPDMPESICSPPDFEDVICYEADAGKWANVMGSVGVMSVGGNPATGLWCSGSNISPDNYLLTNEHCVASQAECSSTEFVFRYYNQNCGSGPTTPDWQSFRCDTHVAESPYVSCEATLTTLDYSLNSVIGDPAAIFGYVQPDPIPITDGEDIYIIQHPDGRPHEITHGGGADVDADGHNLRYYDTLDTEGGSSGSPIYREADDLLIGLHHCGGCSTPGTGNRGMLMSDIYPQIQQYLCSDTLDLAPDGYRDLELVSGDGDAVIEPGETWQLTPLVSNSACDIDGLDVSSTISVDPATTGSVVLTNDAAEFGTAAAGATVGSQLPVLIAVDPAFACGEEIYLDMGDITSSNGGPFPGDPDFATLQVGEFVINELLAEDFSGGIPGDWTVVDGGTGGGVFSTWNTDNPAGVFLPLTAPFALVDSWHAGAGADQDEELISPVIDCTDEPGVELQFAHDFKWYSGGGDERGDVDVRSTATGGAWATVASYSGGPAGGTESIDISAQAAGQSDVQIRFRYVGGPQDLYWGVDDVFVLGDEHFECGNQTIFADGFESGDASRWSTTVP
jgi:hypothetical protein